MTTQDRELLAIGEIVKPFGIRGEFVIRLLTDSPRRFIALRMAFVGPNAERTRENRIEAVSVELRGVRVKLAGIDDRNAAAELVGQFLFVDRAHRVKVPRGRYFVHQVVGLAVVDDEGHPVGRVQEVLKLPGHDVYVIDHDGHEIMIPAVKEFILGIDPPAGMMRVRLIEGMLEQ